MACDFTDIKKKKKKKWNTHLTVKLKRETKLYL